MKKRKRYFMRPDDLLFIYEIEGVLTEPEKEWDQDLIAHWQEGDSHFLFFSRPREEEVRAFLESQPRAIWVRSHRLTYKEWQGGEAASTVSIGKLVFVPPWFSLPERSDNIYLRLDSGVVFGSGTHPTTRDSLTALQWLYEQDRPRKVVDLGCGTGILSLAAVALGAETVLAVDINPACVRTTERNAHLNGMAERIQVKEGRAEDYLEEPADLVLANLHFTVLRDLVGRQDFLEKRWVILSGLLRSEYREIKRVLQTSGFPIQREWDAEFTWFTLAGGLGQTNGGRKR